MGIIFGGATYISSSIKLSHHQQELQIRERMELDPKHHLQQFKGVHLRPKLTDSNNIMRIDKDIPVLGALNVLVHRWLND